MGKKLIPWVVIIILAVNLAFGLPRLEKFSSVDEPYWTYDRTPDFWNNIKKANWKGTKINDKPGITTAILSGAGLLYKDPLPYKGLRNKPKTDEQLEIISKINLFFRLPIYLFCVLMIPLFYFFTKKLLNKTIALIAVSFIGLSPILLGISLIINPDSLLWIFMPLSILSFLVFQKEEKRRYLILSGFFLGLALLTKYVSNIVYVFFIAIIFLEYVIHKEKYSDIGVKKFIANSAINYFTVVLVSLATFFIFFPAAWVKPMLVLKGTLLSKPFKPFLALFGVIFGAVLLDFAILKSKAMGAILDFIAKRKKLLFYSVIGIFAAFIILVIANTYSGMKFSNLEPILASPKSSDAESIFISKSKEAFALTAKESAETMLADTYSLIFGLSPLVFFFLIFALTYYLFSKEKEATAEARTVFYFSLLIILYYVASTLNGVTATVRYQIALYPLAFIIASIGAYKLFQIAAEKKRRYSMALIAIAIAAFSLFSLFSTKPFYFSYASELLPKKYTLNFKDMGDGSYEAARYLNTLPNAQSLVVWSDKGAVCALFRGRCLIGFQHKDWSANTFDYFVISIGRKSRSLKMSGPIDKFADFEKMYSPQYYDYKIELAGRPNNFIKVVSRDSVAQN
ncbi:MAG: glycosyltransferase family 39 protein [Patescibacteria group bacterium]